MAKEWAKPFYKGKQWIQCRDAYISKRMMIDGGMCEICGKRLGYIVHHKTELTANNINDPEISLNEDNLLYVCKSCHDDIHLHGGMVYLWDGSGDLVGAIIADVDES